MAITYSIPLGVPTQILAATAYALPVKACITVSSGPAEVSIDNVTWAAHVSGQYALGAFIRAAAPATILCKPVG